MTRAAGILEKELSPLGLPEGWGWARIDEVCSKVQDGATTGSATVNPLDEEFSLLSNVALLKPRAECLHPFFLKWHLNSPGGFKAMTDQMPPVAEQHEIVRRVEALFTLADKIEARVQAATARIEKIAQAILAKAFRGESVPTEAELARQEGRDYEPAARLLQRIRGRREGLGDKARKGKSR
jgi:hypothetical protein